MSIWLVTKAVLLFGIIVVIVPVLFIIFLTLWGNYFSLAIARDSWLARSNSRVLRSFVARFLI